MRNESGDALAWLRYAAEDLRVAQLALTDNPPLLRSVAYHAQQAAEKLLKAALTAHGAGFSRTHDLELLWKLCQQRDHAFTDIHADCETLNGIGSEVRYPPAGMTEPTIEEARKALQLAQRIAAFVRQRIQPA